MLLYVVVIHRVLPVSTDRQAEEGLGLDVQEKAVKAYLRDRKARAVRWFKDRGVSGAVKDRPALSELLQSLCPGDVIVLARLDRLARDS
jgi:site-specific DNA recombinase